MKLLAVTIIGIALVTLTLADSLPKKISLSHQVLAGTSAQNLTEIVVDYQLGLTNRINEIVDNGGACLLPSGSSVEVLALDQKYEFYCISSSGRVLWVTPESIGLSK